MPNDLDLDDCIRDLVSAAVKTAPAAPDVEFVRPVARKRPTWPKWTAVLAALLAAGGATVALQPANEGDVNTTHDTTVTTQFVPRDEPSVIVTAGDFGIRENVDGVERVVSTYPMLGAVPLDNGEVVAERSAVYTHKASTTDPIRIAADGTVTPLFDQPPAGFTFHDFSIVDGKRTLLYSTSISPPDDPVGRKVTLYTMDLDTKAVTEVAQIGDAFSDTGWLTLASNGLVVGSHEITSGCGFCNDPATASRSLFVVALPGSPAAASPLPKAADYGLKEKYADDCASCPWNYFTDPTGTSLYWVSTVADGTGTAVYSARIAEPGKAPRMLKELPDHGATVEQTVVDISSRGLVVNYGHGSRPGAGPPHGPVLLAGDGEVQLLGQFATVGWQG